MTRLALKLPITLFFVAFLIVTNRGSCSPDSYPEKADETKRSATLLPEQEASFSAREGMSGAIDLSDIDFSDPASFYKIPLKLTFGEGQFDSGSFQRLRGERRLEEKILFYIKKLGNKIESCQQDETFFEDPEFLMIRDHIANYFLELFSYSTYLKGNFIVPVEHTNLLESVTTRPLVRTAIDAIYAARPIFREIVDQVYNEELEDDDFNYKVAIGKSPFFDPLCHLLICLYESKDIKGVAPVFAKVRQTLEKRYLYYTYIHSLIPIFSKVSEIAGQEFLNIEEVSKEAYEYTLKVNEQSDDSEDDFYNYHYYGDLYDDDEEHPEPYTVSPGIEKYLDFVRETALLLKHLHNAIYCNISYRYGLEGREGYFQFPVSLKDARRSIPWSTLSCLSSAARLACDNKQIDIRLMMISAMPGLLQDFQDLKEDLTTLVTSEAHFLLGKAREIQPGRQYPTIQRFVNWYTLFIGLGMPQTHIRELNYYGQSLDNPDILMRGSPEIQKEVFAKKIPFLLEKSRLYSLYYLFVDSELSKYLRDASREFAPKELRDFFTTFGKLRDAIMHEGQKNGQEALETRLSEIDKAHWDELIERYKAVKPVIARLDQRVSRLTWQECVSGGLGEALSLTDGEQLILERFQGYVQHLCIFIETGQWNDPEDVLRSEYEDLVNHFKELLARKSGSQNQKGPTLDSKFFLQLLCRDQQKWKGVFPGVVRKGYRFDPEITSHWQKMEDKAFEYKKYRKERKNPPKKPGLVLLKQNFKNLRWILGEMQKTYRKNFSRFSTVPEGIIGEFYLIILRESANYILQNIDEYMGFESSQKDAVSFINACVDFKASVPQLINSFGNKKAHLHRLSEISSFETTVYNTGNILYLHLPRVYKNIQIIEQSLGD